ncbi:MAG: hemin uptake protein HemP [Methylobacter sp.]|nr:hemin uptake protein HemP [Methylobacter sp.]
MDNEFYESIEPMNSGGSTKQAITPVARPRLQSTELFSVGREVIIEHAGEEYRLRLTRQGKLILTK